MNINHYKPVFLAFFCIVFFCGCFVPVSDTETSLTIILNGTDPNNRAVLTSWPPENDAQRGELRYIIELSGSSSKITKTASGNGPIIIAINPGQWTISVTAYCDGGNEIYAEGSVKASISPGKGNVVQMVLYRAGKYRIEGVTINPPDPVISRGGSQTFIAAVNFGDYVSPGNDREVTWSIEGSYKAGTKIEPTLLNANIATLTIAGDEEDLAQITVKAVSKGDSSKFGTTTASVTALLNAVTPVLDDTGLPAELNLVTSQAAPALNVTVINYSDITAQHGTITSGAGTNSLVYQWRSSGSPPANFLTDGTAIGSPANVPAGGTLSFTPPVTADGTSWYWAAVMNTIRDNTDGGVKTTNGHSKAVKVTVIRPVADIVLTSAATMDMDTTLALTANVLPANATNQNITWSIESDGGMSASINGNNLYAPLPGTVTVKATIVNGSGIGTDFTKTFAITVIMQPVTDIVLTSAATMTAGSPLTLTATVLPANATYKTIVWSVENAGSTGASVTGNVLSAGAAGTVTVKATIANGAAIGTDFAKTFAITVQQPASFTITFDQITDEAALINLSPPIILSHTGAGGLPKSVTVTAPGGYSYKWYIDGSYTGIANSNIGLNVTNNTYNGVGKHYLTLEVTISGVTYSKRIDFEVRN